MVVVVVPGAGSPHLTENKLAVSDMVVVVVPGAGSPHLQVSRALERVRAQADVMPRRQLEQVLSGELGPEWRSKFADFTDAPFAAASIGQVGVVSRVCGCAGVSCVPSARVHSEGGV